MKRFGIGMAALALGLSFPAASHAATVEAMTLEEMARRADLIFIGSCSAIRAEWNAERTRIYTYVTFAVERYLKGGAGENEMTLRVPGGQVGRFRVVVPGTPQFTRGETALLFGVGSRARVPTLLGLSLGKFTLARDAQGETILRRDISSLMLSNYRTDSRPVGAPPTRYRLSEVESRIEEALNR